MRRAIAAASALIACLASGSIGGVATASAGHHGSADHHRWVHHANLDGDGHPDRIVLTAGRRLHIDQDQGTGPYTLHVRLSSTRQRLRLRLSSDEYFSSPIGHRRWSPWFGATHLDYVGGKELLLGEQSGASSSAFYAIAYTGGRLVELPAPDGPQWFVNSDAEDGNSYSCTSGGITETDYYAHGKRLRQRTNDRDHYIWQDDRWIETAAQSRTRREPRHPSTRDLQRQNAHDVAGFLCPGLPRVY